MRHFHHPRIFAVCMAFAVVFACLTGNAVAEDAKKAPLREVIAVFPEVFPPYFSFSGEGRPEGFAIDVLNELADRAGIKITYRPMGSWVEVNKAIRSGEADIIPNMGITEDRKEFFRFTVPTDTFVVSVFTRKDRLDIRSLDDLSGKTIGVVKTHVAARLLAKRKDVELRYFDHLPDIMLGLLSGRVDAIAYPERVAWKRAKRSGFDNSIKVIRPQLAQVQRAIGVRKNAPELHALLDRELRAFIETPEFTRIYRKWHGPSRSDPGVIGVDQLLWASAAILVMVLLSFFLNRLLTKRQRLQDYANGSSGLKTKNKTGKRVGLLIAVLAVVTFIATAVALGTLYQASFIEHEKHMAETAKSHANLFEAVARFDKTYNSNYPGGSMKATIGQIKEGLAPFGGTMELTLAQRKGEKIVFILRQRATQQYEPAPVDYNSPRAEPMRRALQGKSGTVTGLDYRNEMVLAAHEPAPLLGLGVVVKMDISEIRAPYIHAGTIAALTSIGLILVGTFFFFRLTNPIITQLQESERQYRTLVEGHSELMCRSLPDGTLTFVNDAYCRYFGKKRKELIGHKFMPMIPKEDHGKVEDHFATLDCMTRTAVHEHRVIIPTGAVRWNRWTNKVVCDADENVLEILSIGYDITESKHMERALLAITECNKALIHAVNEEKLLPNICRIIVEIAGYKLAWVGYAEHDSRKRVRPVAQDGYVNGYLDEIKITWDDSELGHGPTGAAIRTRKPQISQNIDTNPSFKPWRKEALKRGYKSSVALPLQHREKVLGALNIYSAEPDSFDAREIELLQELADDLAYGIVTQREAEKRHEVEEALKESEWRHRSVTDSTRDAIIAIDTTDEVISWNKGARIIFGYTEKEMLGKSLSTLIPEQYKKAHKAGLKRVRNTGENRLIGKTVELTALHKDGSEFPIELTVGSWGGYDGKFFSGIIRDISERKESERQLRQAQKMDSLGNMAGGIAHDLNNMLLPILTLTGMTAKKLPENSSERNRLDKVVQAAEKARDLVKRILAFSRHEADIKKKNIDLYVPVREAMDLLHSTLPATIEIKEKLDKNVGEVFADSAQIQTVLLNLASNSCDAMEGKPGEVEVILKRIRVTKKMSGEVHGLTPGVWAKLSVLDTGHGMDKKTLSCVFDPFFTTKGVGEGTGLGLSMVHGIITSHGGAIVATSSPGKGAAFDIYLPLVQEAANSSGEKK